MENPLITHTCPHCDFNIKEWKEEHKEFSNTASDLQGQIGNTFIKAQELVGDSVTEDHKQQGERILRLLTDADQLIDEIVAEYEFEW